MTILQVRVEFGSPNTVISSSYHHRNNTYQPLCYARADGPESERDTLSVGNATPKGVGGSFGFEESHTAVGDRLQVERDMGGERGSRLSHETEDGDGIAHLPSFDDGIEHPSGSRTIGGVAGGFGGSMAIPSPAGHRGSHLLSDLNITGGFGGNTGDRGEHGGLVNATMGGAGALGGIDGGMAGAALGEAGDVGTGAGAGAGANASGPDASAGPPFFNTKLNSRNLGFGADGGFGDAPPPGIGTISNTTTTPTSKQPQSNLCLTFIRSPNPCSCSRPERPPPLDLGPIALAPSTVFPVTW